MYHEARNMNVGREVLTGISFLPSIKFVGLQGADMVAWETYNHAREWLQDRSKPTRPHLTPLAELAGFLLTLRPQMPSMTSTSGWQN